MIIKLVPDTSAESPRDWENVGTMVCWHRRYSLGDEQPDCDPHTWARCSLTRDTVYLPLYLYDHGNITMNTTGFSCPWDSGQVGWIYASRARLREQFGWKRLTAQRIEHALKVMRAEVETYSQYISGEVYGFLLETDDGDVVDSCFGFYGMDPMTNGMFECVDPDHRHLLKEAEFQWT